MHECSITHKKWGELTPAELYAFLKLRTDVFFVEQRIDEEELDNRDQEPTTEHLWISDAAGTAAYLRLLRDDSPSHLDARRILGRLAVRADRRGEGLAQLLVTRAIELRGAEAIVLHAQHYIAPLYSNFGFREFGEVYVEASIPHISMYRAGSAGR